MRSWWQECADVVLPSACAGCGAPRARGQVCGGCRERLGAVVPRRVRPVCGGAGVPRVFAAAVYRDEVRALLLAHKERGALALAVPLGELLARAVLAAVAVDGGTARPDGRPLTLVPVPSAARTVARRGHDPVRRVARRAAAVLRGAGVAAVAAPVLRQARAVADQAGLDAVRRRANLDGALCVLPRAPRLLEGTRVVLVDDVVTTGASLREAARALAAAGRPRYGPPWCGVAGAAVVAARDQPTSRF